MQHGARATGAHGLDFFMSFVTQWFVPRRVSDRFPANETSKVLNIATCSKATYARPANQGDTVEGSSIGLMSVHRGGMAAPNSH
jgi:hypothetical protein